MPSFEAMASMVIQTIRVFASSNQTLESSMVE